MCCFVVCFNPQLWACVLLHLYLKQLSIEIVYRIIVISLVCMGDVYGYVIVQIKVSNISYFTGYPCLFLATAFFVPMFCQLACSLCLIDKNCENEVQSKLKWIKKTFLPHMLNAYMLCRTIRKQILSIKMLLLEKNVDCYFSKLRPRTLSTRSS